MSVYERNGHWHLSVVINGKRIRKAIKEAQTKRQAEKAEKVLRNEIFENRYGDGGQRLFSDFVENSYKPKAKQSNKGFNVELSILKALIKKFGKFRLAEITPEKVDQFKRERSTEITNRGKKRSIATVNRDFGVLSAIFTLAVKYGELKENPVKRVGFYTDLPKRERILTDAEEIRLFQSVADDIEFSRKIEILLYTGMRRGELFKLEWRDVDLQDGFINLRKETTKTEKARIIPMLSNVQAIIQTVYEEADEPQPNDIIFDGSPNRANNFTLKFTAVCKDLGVEDFTVHNLRHTFSTRADKFEVGAFAQKNLLGHSKLNQTSNYTHQSKETLKKNLIGFEKHLTLVRKKTS